MKKVELTKEEKAKLLKAIINLFEVTEYEDNKNKKQKNVKKTK